MEVVMKNVIAAVSLIALVSIKPATAFATEPISCVAGEGLIVEYDFNVIDGVKSLKHYPRIASSICLEGRTNDTRLRGVDAPLKGRNEVSEAMSAAETFVKLGITDAAVIKQLIDRVAPVYVAQKAAEAKKPQTTKTAVESKSTSDMIWPPWPGPSKK